MEKEIKRRRVVCRRGRIFEFLEMTCQHATTGFHYTADILQSASSIANISVVSPCPCPSSLFFFFQDRINISQSFLWYLISAKRQTRTMTKTKTTANLLMTYLSIQNFSDSFSIWCVLSIVLSPPQSDLSLLLFSTHWNPELFVLLDSLT